jgi:hypothetical protein
LESIINRIEFNNLKTSQYFEDDSPAEVSSSPSQTIVDIIFGSGRMPFLMLE